MLWTPLTERALNTAARLHDGRHRKGEEKNPEIVHLVAVASIVSQYTDDEEVVAAALLHDTIEDTSYTAFDLKKEFGDRVCELVCGVTIPEAHDEEGHEWKKDRTRYYENLKDAPNESALIAAVDKLHNFTSILRQYEESPEQFQKEFGGTKEDRILVYKAIVDLLIPRIPKELADDLQSVWEKYKTFVQAL